MSSRRQWHHTIALAVNHHGWRANGRQLRGQVGVAERDRRGAIAGGPNLRHDLDELRDELRRRLGPYQARRTLFRHAARPQTLECLQSLAHALRSCRLRQRPSAGVGVRQEERSDSTRMTMVDQLGDHTAHRHAQHVSALDLQLVEQQDGAIGQVLQGERRRRILRAPVARRIPGNDVEGI